MQIQYWLKQIAILQRPEDGSMVTDLTPTLMWEEPDDQDDAIASFGNQIFSLGCE